MATGKAEFIVLPHGVVKVEDENAYEQRGKEDGEEKDLRIVRGVGGDGVRVDARGRGRRKEGRGGSGGRHEREGTRREGSRG